jgi:peptide/nickel transport system permease protein
VLSFLLRRILITIPVAVGVSTITFLLLHFVPGDPVDIMLGEQAATVDKQALRQELGLNRTLADQYWRFVSGIAHGDLGRSLHSRKPVTEEIRERLPATVELTFGAMFLAICLSIPLGVLAAIRQYSWVDNTISVGGLLGMSLPGFFLGPMLIWFFSIKLDLLPVSERGGIENLILPAISLSLPLAAILIRMTRANMLEVIREDYVRVARAKGLSSFRIYFKHALANAIMPVITIIGMQFGGLLTGTVITETVFDWPGLGTLMFGAIQQRNYPMVQGCVLLISLTYVLVNLLTDIAYAFANPKIRLS